MITDPGHGLRLGGLQIVENGKAKVHADGFTTEVSADGTTWGDPEPVIVEILSMLHDGTLETTTSHGNRHPVVFVRIKGNNGPALAAGEMALNRELGRPTELIWQPPDASAPPTVWEVVNSYMAFGFDHQAELRRTRTYRVTLSARPWGRSAVLVHTPALAAPPGSPTTVTIDTMDSTTGWSAASTAGVSAFTSTGGALRTTVRTSYTGDHSITLTRTIASVDLTATPYVAVDYDPSGGWSLTGLATAAGALTKVNERAIASGRRRAYFDLGSLTPAATTTFVLTFTGYFLTGRTSTVDTYQLDRTDTISTGTGRQGSRSITPGGGVAAEGDVIVEKAGTALGQTLVYSRSTESMHAVNLRQYRVSGSTETADTSKVSGIRSEIGSGAAEVFEIPVALFPKGNVHVWGSLGSSSGTGDARINYTVAVMQGSTIISGSQQSGYTYVNLPAAAANVTPYLRPLARFSLPGLVEGPNAKVRVTFIKDASTGASINPLYDELWMFEVDDARLTILDLPTGTPAAGSVPSRLKITAPDLLSPNGEIRLATAADFSDAWSPTPAQALVDQTGHRFPVEGAEIFVATVNAQNVDVSFDHYPRGHTHAPYVDS